MKTNKYCIYCRKAAIKDESSVACINQQKEVLEKYANDNKLDIVGTYIDVGLEPENRNKMLEAIKNKQANCIIVLDESRLARNHASGKQIIELLESGAIDEIRTLERIYKNDTYSRFSLTFVFGNSDFYREAVSDSIKRGIAAAKLRKSQS